MVPQVGTYGLETWKELGKSCLLQIFGGIYPFLRHFQALGILESELFVFF